MQRNPHSYQIATGYRTFYSLSLIYQPITKKTIVFKKKVSFCAFLRHCIAIITYLYHRIKTTNIFKYEKIIYSPFDCGCCGRY